MTYGNLHKHWAVYALILGLVCSLAPAQQAREPSKVYVPYEKLKGVFESEQQGVFLPYAQFRKLWAAAQGTPADVKGAPVRYLISTARFTGKVGQELASMRLELTVDILADDWVEVPIGLGEVAVAKVEFADGQAAPRPLLRVINGQYRLLTRGKGRHVLNVDFVRQLVTKPGLNVLSFRIPSSAISTLELLIPGENMKVDVKPMLAATTTQVTAEGKKATQLQAFLGSAESVELSWKPKTQAAADLEPVVIADQLQHIHVDEALVSYQVNLTYDIRRRGVDSFVVQLPGGFRVIAVEGVNISNWDIPKRPGDKGPQSLQVKLFSPAKGPYSLVVKMEHFLKETDAEIPLSPIVTQQVLRRTGLIAITHSPRRSVELREPKSLARVDTARLPKDLRQRPGVTAYRFITADYAGTLAIATVTPRITVRQYWALGIRADRLELQGLLNYTVERAGVFELTMGLPEPWEVVSLGPNSLVDDFRLAGEGPDRKLKVLLRKELLGTFQLNLLARAPRSTIDQPVNFVLPQADRSGLKLYAGELILRVAEQLRVEVDRLDQFQSLPLSKATQWRRKGGLTPVMAFEFRSIDPARSAGASFKVAVKPTQISAVVHRLVNIQPGSIEQETVIRYQVRYAPVDTLYLKMPASLAETVVQIVGDPDSGKPRIKEKPRIDSLPKDQQESPAEGEPGAKIEWAYFKVVLQSPVIGDYQVKVTTRESFRSDLAGGSRKVTVAPILAAGSLTDQSGQIAIAKADTLAVIDPATKNLIPADPSSPEDLPYGPHRKIASLAFKYSAPPFELSFAVLTQKEAAVFTTMVTGAIIDQELAPDGMLRTRAIYLLKTARGDRLPITLPDDATPYAFLLNGKEEPMEEGASKGQLIVRLPPSAGQVATFVLEVGYSVRRTGSALAVPKLPDDIPVQQTLWRVRLPEDDYVLGYDRHFSRVTPGQWRRAAGAMQQGQPVSVTVEPANGERVWHFVRLGTGKLSIVLVDRKWFLLAVWVVVLGAGVAMLKLGWFHRVLVVLAVGVVGMFIALFAPLFIQRVSRGYAAGPAGLVVLLLWLAHWLAVQVPARLKARGPTAPPLAETATEEAPQSDQGQTGKGQ